MQLAYHGRVLRDREREHQINKSTTHPTEWTIDSEIKQLLCCTHCSPYLHFKERTAERWPAENRLQKGHLSFLNSHTSLFVISGGNSLKRNITACYITLVFCALLLMKLMIFHGPYSPEANWDRDHRDDIMVILFQILPTVSEVHEKTETNKWLLIYLFVLRASLSS